MTATGQGLACALVVLMQLVAASHGLRPHHSRRLQLGAIRGPGDGSSSGASAGGDDSSQKTPFRGTTGDADCSIPNAGASCPRGIYALPRRIACHANHRACRRAGKTNTLVYLASMEGLAVALGSNHSLVVPSGATSGQPAAARFLLDTNGSIARPCSSLVYLKSLDRQAYCRFADLFYATVISGGIDKQGVVCDLASSQNATAFVYEDNMLTFMLLRLSVTAQGQVVFGRQNETLAPGVPVAPGEGGGGRQGTQSLRSGGPGHVPGLASNHSDGMLPARDPRGCALRR